VLIAIVVGQSEMEAEAVNIRNRDDEDQKREETVGLQDAVDKLVRLQKSRASVAKLE
jgi:threonyl-tRNA synthetase